MYDGDTLSTTASAMEQRNENPIATVAKITISQKSTGSSLPIAGPSIGPLAKAVAENENKTNRAARIRRFIGKGQMPVHGVLGNYP